MRATELGNEQADQSRSGTAANSGGAGTWKKLRPLIPALILEKIEPKSGWVLRLFTYFPYLKSSDSGKLTGVKLIGVSGRLCPLSGRSGTSRVLYFI